MKRQWTYHCFFLVVIGLAGVILLVTLGLLAFDILLYLPPFSSGEILFFSFSCMILLSIIWFGVWRIRESDRWWKRLIKTLVLILALLMIGLVLLASYVFNADSSCLQYTSPDGQHSIVIENQGFLAVEWGTVYEMTSPITMKEIGTFHENFHPRYSKMIWHDTYLELIVGGESLCFPYL